MLLNQDNPVLARYWVDEEMETIRVFFKEISAVFEKQKNIKDLRQTLGRLDDKWYEKFKQGFGSLTFLHSLKQPSTSTKFS